MIMLDRFSGSTITVAIAATVVGAVMSASITGASAQALKTSWGEPDLQGIWTDEFDTALQRPAKYATEEFFTEAQRAELDQARSAGGGRLVPAPPKNSRAPTAPVSFPQPT